MDRFVVSFVAVEHEVGEAHYVAGVQYAEISGVFVYRQVLETEKIQRGFG